MTTNPNYKMLINLDQRDSETRRWDTGARFEYGIHAMEAARTLSEGTGREWRVVDNRHEEGALVVTYKDGAAIWG